MSGSAARPWWQTWRGLIPIAVVALAGIVLGVSLLPVAPVAPNVKRIPDTAVGGLVAQIEMVNYQSAQVGWAVVPTNPYWRVVRTKDGGARWQDVTPPGNGTNGGLSLTVMGPATAAVVFLAFQYIRDSTFAFTTDGGADWTAGILPNAASKGPDPIYVLNPHTIFAVLGSGIVVGSADGGSTWSDVSLTQPSSGACSPTSVWFTSAESGWISGTCTGIAALWHSTDAGRTWQSALISTAYSDSAEVSVRPPQGSGSGDIYTTAVAKNAKTESLRVFYDSSDGWTSAPALALPAGRVLASFSDASSGWVLVVPSTRGSLALAYFTSNQGVNWSIRTTPVAADQVTSLDLISPENVVVLSQAGNQSELWTSANAGVSWRRTRMLVFDGPQPRVNGITG